MEGRFMTEDPIKDGSNWYVYVGNSPMNYVDPLGLCSSYLNDVGAYGGSNTTTVDGSWNGYGSNNSQTPATTGITGEGWNVTVGAGFRISVSAGKTSDGGSYSTIGAGFVAGWTVSASYEVISAPDATSTSDLAGPTAGGGGSVGYVGSVGHEVNTSLTGGPSVTATTFGFALGTPVSTTNFYSTTTTSGGRSSTSSSSGK